MVPYVWDSLFKIDNLNRGKYYQKSTAKQSGCLFIAGVQDGMPGMPTVFSALKTAI